MLMAHVAPLFGATDVSAAGNAMRELLQPLMLTLTGLASLVAVFFLIFGGYQYMTSKGSPDKLEHAKRVVRNALVGLVIVIAAGTLTTILTSSYNAGNESVIENLPSLQAIEPQDGGGGIVEVLVKAIVGLFKHIVVSAAKPFISALEYFTTATPLMGDNSAVFRLWLTVVGLADALFVVVLALLGFHVMSAASLGFDEIEFKHMLPQLALTFLFVNTSLFAIDLIIGVSNGMIKAMSATFGDTSVFKVLSDVAGQAGGMGLVALMILVVFLILSVILLVYYVTRLVVLYLGAILSPLIALLLLLPGFKDFAITAIKTYLTTVFVLFVHVLILLLAASVFAGMVASGSDKVLNPLMSTIVGIATLIALLKTQGVMQQMAYVSVGPRAMRKLGGQFINGVSYTTSKVRSVNTSIKETRKVREAK